MIQIISIFRKIFIRFFFLLLNPSGWWDSYIWGRRRRRWQQQQQQLPFICRCIWMSSWEIKNKYWEKINECTSCPKRRVVIANAAAVVAIRFSLPPSLCPSLCFCHFSPRNNSCVHIFHTFASRYYQSVVWKLEQSQQGWKLWIVNEKQMF